MDRYIESLKENVQRNLSLSAKAYLDVGMREFYEVRHVPDDNFQPAVGNLAIGIELMLKSLIAKKSFVFLYKNLPIELKIMLTQPESVIKTSNPRLHGIDLKSFASYKIINVGDCIVIFYIYYPNLKQEYKPYFKLLSSVRDISVHASLPSFQRYDLERIAYAALQLSNFLNEEDVLASRSYDNKKKDKEFLATYAKERVERVERKIEAAKKQSKEIKHPIVPPSAEGWESYVIECPICSCSGILEGDTETSGEGFSVDYEDYGLTFLAEGFKCEPCGLELTDTEELKLAGIETVYDRSDELDEWTAKDPYTYDDFYDLRDFYDPRDFY